VCYSITTELTAQETGLRRALTEKEEDTLLRREASDHFKFDRYANKACFRAQRALPAQNSSGKWAVPNPGQWEWEPIILPVTGKICYQIDRDEADWRGTNVVLWDLERAALQ
jgi:hypothetical protein